MKFTYIYWVLIFTVLLPLSSCEEYLNIPPEASLFDEDVFSTYESFQGYQDEIMERIVDYNRHGARRSMAIAGEAVSIANFSVAQANNGDYVDVFDYLPFVPHTEGGAAEEPQSGLYTDMWWAVRTSNICLNRLEEGFLANATDEQRDWLRGQALFYRAFWHYEFARIWGSIPYIDAVIPPGEELSFMNRYWEYEKNGQIYRNTQAVFERVIEDMEAAAELLPTIWPQPNINFGRPTRLACLAFKAKALHMSASPLFNEDGGNPEEYNQDLLGRCAVACQEVIDLAKSVIGQQPAGMPTVNPDGLTEFEDFTQMFGFASGNTQPGTPEVLFKKPTNHYGPGPLRQTAGRTFGDQQLTNQPGAQGSQQYVDKFEMADGTRYRPEYDRDDERRWKNRDPRFYRTFYVHGDTVGSIVLNQTTTQRRQAFNCYVVRKYYPDGVNRDNFGGFGWSTPYIRLADIYLAYAEAAYEASGSYTTIPAGGSMTAEEAVNIVRRRAGMPEVSETLPDYEQYTIPLSEERSDDPAFRLLYRNERAVELAYEAVYWFDLRRWKRAHLKNATPIQVLNFDLVGGNNQDLSQPIDNQTLTRVPAPNSAIFVFNDRQYWFPFLPSDDIIFFTEDWPQNPGW